MLNAKEQRARSCKGMVACSRGKRNELGWPCPLAAAASPGLKETRGPVECNKRGGLEPRLARVFRRHKDWAGPRGQTSNSLRNMGLREWRRTRETLLRCHKEPRLPKTQPEQARGSQSRQPEQEFAALCRDGTLVVSPPQSHKDMRENRKAFRTRNGKKKRLERRRLDVPPLGPWPRTCR